MATTGTDRWSGRFWLAETPDREVGGWLDVSDRWPALDLSEALTSPYRQTSATELPDGSWMVAAESADDDVQALSFTVHGFVRGAAQRVTLVDTQSVGRNMALNVLDDWGSQRLTARYAFMGGHVDGAEVRFRRVRFRLRHLDAWAQLREGMTIQFAQDGSHAAMSYDDVPSQSAPTATTSGLLTLDTTLQLAEPTVVEVRFTRHTYLEWECGGEGQTMDELWSRILDPLRTLLTLASGADCPVTSVRVQQDDGPWLRVAHPGIGAPSDRLRQGRDMVLTAPDLELAHLAAWLDHVDQLSPVPQLVAAQVEDRADQVVESQVLELAAAAEGLHRRMHRDARVLTDERAKQVRRACLAAVGDPEERRAVSDRLRHLDEPTFRARLEALAADARGALPDVTGVTSAWTRMVADARNGFAHLLQQRRETEVEQNLVLRDSLRWLLTVVLFERTGVEAEVLGARLASRQDYIHFMWEAQVWLPEIYGGSEASSDGQ